MLTDCSALAHPQLAQDQFQVLAVALVSLVVDLAEDSFPAVDLLVDLALLLATSAVDPTTSLVIVRTPKALSIEALLTVPLRPSSGHEMLCLRQARSHLARLYCSQWWTS
jgi:hypothetical protein